ncbi:gliding motility-associated C-terminal domain-containing protein [Dyadobacter koreensis]|uniref:Gliding motility-associated C-terminal domain-containing protein n=1 Tax=Dyadobacter koreensis TaxID=408657 RepID=A0A1H6Q974_9BACT|nr:gliding motility-associated C-terminal domain-containing protein [Dyadobacter koreensis]SEI40318.1 gliding motility-associated C-terminal domain-containing protein [Dyadobacter koreensis]
MFRFIILFSGILLTSAQSYSQPGKRANIWYFGYNAGLDFNSGKPVGLRDGALYQREGCSSIADEKGNLILYTDGIRIWNKKHKLISADTQLGGDDTSTQSALIVPMPGNPNIYYVFSTFTKLVCVTIDISLYKGNGGVVSRSVLLENSTEKLAAVQHCNQRDFWILAHENGNRVFRSFLLTEQGIAKSSVVSKIGTPLDFYKSVGNMKFSQQGDKLAMAVFGKSQYQLFNFDNSLGTLSDEVSLKHMDFLSAYGLEFSPSGKFLYVSETVNVGSSIFQLDISDMDAKKIIASKTEIGKPPESYFGSMQLGPDGKIYVARSGLKYLGVIHTPDLKGSKCAYVNNGFELPAGVNSMGLPNYFVTPPILDPTVTIQIDDKCNDVTLTAETNHRFSKYVFQWYNGKQEIRGANMRTYTPKSSGDYSVILIGECLDKKVISTSINVKILEISADYSTLECGLLELSVRANASIVWTGKGVSVENEHLRKIQVSGSGKDVYYVRVLDEHDPSCYIEKKLDVNFGVCDASVFIPDIFTPNGDHINDAFDIVISNGEGVDLRIYDRWGNIVHHGKKSEIPWDGKVNGTDALIGTYTYVLQYKNNRGHEFTRRGTVFLQR